MHWIIPSVWGNFGFGVLKTSTGRGHVLLSLSTGKLHFIPSRLLCSCKSKSRNEWVWVCAHVWSCELSLIFFHMLHCIKCSVGLDANIALLLLQSSPVYCHHLWNSKQQHKSSIYLDKFPIPCCFHHSSPPSVTAFVPPAAQSHAPAAKGWRVECWAAGKGWCVKPCCWRQCLCDSTSMKDVMDVVLEAGPD